MPLFRPGSILDRLAQRVSSTTVYPAPSFQSLVYKDFGLPPTFHAEKTQEAYGDNPYLYSAINVIAHEVARTDFHLVRQTKTGTKDVVSHQAMETLAHPQPTDGGKSLLTRYQLLFLLTQYLLLNGENYWVLDGRMRASGAPTVIAPLNPAYVYEKLNDDGTIRSYVYRLIGGMSEDRIFDPMDVVHFKLPDPKNWYRGLSPVQPIRFAVDTYKKADVLNTKRLDNNAMPGGALETDKNPNDIERKRLQDQWNQNYAGTKNAGKTIMLPNGFKFNAMQMSNLDMQFIEGKNLTRDEILANYRVGLELFGHTESQTRANADAAVYVFQRFTVLPVLEMVADTLTHDYLPAFPGADGMEFTFDDPVPENEDNKRATAETLYSSGAATPNELRQMFGLDPLKLDGMDTPYVSFNVVPIGSPPAPLTEPNTNPAPTKK